MEWVRRPGLLRGRRRAIAIVWVGMAAYVLGVYLVVVLGGGALIGQTSSPHFGLSVLATAVVALGFERVQTWLDDWTAHIVTGGRRSPYDVLVRLSEAATAQYPTEELPGRMALLLAEGTGAEWAQIWIFVRGRLTLAATWPSAAAAPAGDWDGESSSPGQRTHPVRQGGELLGVLRVREREGEPLTPVEERLFAGLAGQAGLVLRGVRLRAELAERFAELTTRADELAFSRRRLVDIQDAERRRLERDIHDGAQQHLVALSVNLRLAQQLIDRSPDRARLVLAEQADAARETIRTLTNLALGIYPSRLGSKGVAAALEEAAATSAVQVEISAAVDRYAPAIEAAIYFICLEAIQNAAKHADADHVAVSIWETDRTLVTEITDDGVGFVPDDLAEGEGIANMRVRAETVGGGLDVGSTPGTGTTVRAWVPLRITPAPAEWTP